MVTQLYVLFYHVTGSRLAPALHTQRLALTDQACGI